MGYRENPFPQVFSNLVDYRKTSWDTKLGTGGNERKKEYEGSRGGRGGEGLQAKFSGAPEKGGTIK